MLRGLAEDAPAAFDAFLEWSGDGEQHGLDASFILVDFSGLARANEQVALRILRMPFLRDVEYPDPELVKILRNLASNDPEGLEYVLGYPAFEGGITDEHAPDVFLLNLERMDESAADAIRRLSWVQDGVTRGVQSEDDHVIDLAEIALELPTTFDALLLRTWTRDGITRSEGSVLNTLSQVAESPFNDEEIRPLVSMPFLQTVDEIDSWLVSALLGTLYRSAYGVRDIITRREVQGGITDAQRAMVGLWVLDRTNQEAADRLRALPWVRDGLQLGERQVFLTLWGRAEHDQTGRIFQLLMSKPWVRDDITPLETEVVDRLMGICYASDDCSTALPRVMNMPFLDTIERADLDTLQDLAP